MKKAIQFATLALVLASCQQTPTLAPVQAFTLCDRAACPYAATLLWENPTEALCENCFQELTKRAQADMAPCR